ncbi:MAG: hypothetical protein JSV04_05740, partial [Candidatus Heimdallarchaeota archaeon]
LFLVIGMAMFYPGKEALTEFIQLMTFLGDFPTDNPGFSLWLIFFCGFALSLYLPIAGIFLGSSLLPINERDGKEVFFSTPKSLTMSFLENSVVVTILIVLIALPSYLASLGLLYMNNAWDAVTNITICFTLAIMLVIAITFLTAFGCTINFSKITGYAIGGLYIVFSIVVYLTGQQIEDIDFLLELSLFYRADVVNSSLLTRWNEEFIALVFVLVVVLVVASIFLLYRKDFLEKGVQQQTVVDESEQEEQKRASKISIIRTPVDKLLGKLGWKFPAVRDQLHANATVFIIFLGFMIFYSFYVISMYMEEEVGELLQSFNMPFMEALLFGNKIQELPQTIETYLAFEIFSFAWMVIAPFILIVIYDIIMRDYRKQYAEITWTLPKTGTRIFVSRTIAALIYFIFASLASFVILMTMEILLDRVSDFIPTVTSYLIFTWGYSVVLVFFLSLALLVPSKHALKTLMISYVFFVLIIFVAFLPGTDLSWLRFLTPFGYFDSISLILGKRDFILDVLPEAVVGTLLTIIFYIIVLKRRIP